MAGTENYRRKLPPGEKLPSEQALRKQFDVSRQTVRRALEVLEEQGLTYGQQGKGTFVTDPALEEQNKSRQIAVVTTYVDNYIFPRIIQGIEQILSAGGLSGTDCLYKQPDSERKRDSGANAFAKSPGADHRGDQERPAESKSSPVSEVDGKGSTGTFPEQWIL